MVREAAGGGILDDLSDALDIDVGGDGKKGKVRGKKGGRASRMKRRSAAWLRRMKRSATSISSKFPNIPKPAIPRIPKIPGFDKNTLKALKNNPMFKGAGKLAKGAGPAGAVIAGLELYDAVQSGDPRQIGRSIAGIGTGMGGAWPSDHARIIRTFYPPRLSSLLFRTGCPGASLHRHRGYHSCHPRSARRIAGTNAGDLPLP